MAHPTNVVKFARALRLTGPDGVSQVPIYVPGVGTGQGVTRMSRVLDRWLGGMFGWGLLDNIADAYRHLAFVYEPGDAIFVTGFSRGAYTARSLVGLIRATGIIARDRLDRLPGAVERYRDRSPSSHPDTDASHAFRAEVSPGIATSARERAWRAERGDPETPLLQIDYVGVWDTVGALGIPGGLTPFMRAGRYRFHDTALSRMVTSARHAIALDERRRTFPPSRWNNVDALNRAAGEERYREWFFAGDHGSVGGGGDVVALSNIALDWIVEGAVARGLAVDPETMAGFRRAADPMGPLRNRTAPPGLIGRLLRLWTADRAGPDDSGALHPAVIERYRADATYRPAGLRRIAGDIAKGTPTA